MLIALPPPNDHYLASVPIASARFAATVDTSEATTQTDVFEPSRDGRPLGGGPPEPLACHGAILGKTVWYDLHPQFAGGVDVAATAAFGVSLALYEYDPATARITRPVACTTRAGERLLVDLDPQRDYTLQVGGTNGAGGPLTLNLDYFRDRDGDGELDGLDECPAVRGIRAAAGCPPELKVTPSVTYRATGAGVVIDRLVVARVPRGASVKATCSGCRTQTVRVKRAGRITLDKLSGRSVKAPGTIDLRVTLKPTGAGKYRFGATGAAFTWPVQSGRLGTRRSACLNATTAKEQPCR